MIDLGAMSATTRMLVLGVVRMFQPVSGYAVHRELVSWHSEEWAQLAPGSIYNQLRTLAKDGFIELAGTGQTGGRPEKTLYKITPHGEMKLSEILRDQLWTVRMPVDPLVAVVSMMGFVKRDELISALEARAAMISGSMAHAKYAIEAIDDVETPAHVREMLLLINARVGSELAWSKAFVEQLRAGAYRTAENAPWFPGQAKTIAKKPPKSKRTSQKRR
ncbi:MAG TPA: PadR family transcriptional regulator [Kofleriaceae bacterium]